MPSSIEGTEAASLAEGITGSIAWLGTPENTIKFISIPGSTVSTITLPDHPIDCISAPDAQGRLAFVQADKYTDDLFEAGKKPGYWLGMHSLVTNKDTILAERNVHYDFSQLALSTKGGLLAVVNVKENEGDGPSPTLLETWDLNTKKVVTHSALKNPHSPAWMPNANILLVEERLSRKECPPQVDLSAPNCPTFVDGTIGVVTSIDILSDKITRLQAGRNPVPSYDGKHIFVAWQREVLKIDAATGAVVQRNIDLPGKFESTENIINNPFEDRLIYAGLATKGEIIEPIPDTQFSKWTIKVTSLTKGGFCTLVRGIDNLRLVYGTSPRPEIPKTK